MTSPDIQKDIVHAIASAITKAIIKDLENDFFCILVDEARDVSIKEQMAIVLRFVDQNGSVVERFLGISHVKDTKALTLKNEIEAMLVKNALSLSRIRGQGYDGASNMKGEINGLKSLILAENPSAHYVHCFAHQLQLTLVAVAKNHCEVSYFVNSWTKEVTPHGLTATMINHENQQGKKKAKQGNYDEDLAAAAAAVSRNDSELQKLISEAPNLDNVSSRRLVRQAFKVIQHQIDHCLMKIPYDGLKIDEQWYEVNRRGLEIFSKSWLPGNSSSSTSTTPKALVFYCHGYGETCTFVFEGIARKLALSGYAVFAMDYPGFGLSQGLHGYIPNIDMLSSDVADHFSKFKGKPEYRGLRSYLFGQSLGGAVALKVHLKQPKEWDGAILVAPMCKFAENMIPNWIVLKILIGVAHLFPKLKIVPHQNFVKMAFRDPKKRDLVGLPLLILHGEADVVTDPSVSKALYEKSSSWDKKFTLYKDAYHSLLEGETDEMIFRVMDDIISWLDEHHHLHIQPGPTSES
ncbi:Caffeoylshikimate esterase [Linum perenne]